MKSYYSGFDTAITIDLVDDDGNQYIANSAQYRVLDESEVEIVPPGAATLQDAGASVLVSVPALSNTLAPGVFRGLRRIELMVNTGEGTVLQSESYMIVANEQLIVGVNSYQAYSEAQLNSMDIPNLAAWGDATQKERIAALVESHTRLGRLQYSISSLADAQDRLTPAAVTNISNMAELTAAELSALPGSFMLALKKAQIIEADTALGGDPIDEQRRGGLMSTSIGEVSQMYRPGAPLVLAVSARALRYLTGYVKFGMKIGRAN